jgi:flagellar protein FlaG
MEVYGIKPIDSGVIQGVSPTTGQDQSAKQPDNRHDQGQVMGKTQGHKDLSREEADQVTDEMNSIVQALNTKIQFQLHDKTKQLMVQVVDINDGKVLKEFPPHELLDVMAKIREYVGSLIDKKA